MNCSRWNSLLATLLLALFIMLVSLVIWLGLRNPVLPLSTPDIVIAFMLIAFPTVGWLIAVRRPENPLGWLFLVFPLLLGVGVISDELAALTAKQGIETAATTLIILGAWLQFAGYQLLLGPCILLFPDGKIPGTWFKRAFFVLVVGFIIWGLSFALSNDVLCVVRYGDPIDPCVLSVKNPFALIGNAVTAKASDVLSTLLFVLTLGVSVTGIILRYRRSTGEIQQQIKWVAWVSGLGMLGAIVIVILELIGIGSNPWIDTVFFAIIALGYPVAVAFSILKFHLYDIDRIISRTAAYSLVVAVLGSVYAAVVALMQLILPVESQFGIVVSTLVVAAIFNPLRRRVQNAVNRRFYRSVFDAQQVLDEFSTQLRDNLDLEQVQDALVSVVRETMQPEFTNLWLQKVDSRMSPQQNVMI